MNINKILTLNILSRYKLILIAVVITAVLLTACNNNVIDPPPDEEPLPKITIINEDVSCTEVWLKIKVDSLNTPSDIKLYRDSSLILNLSASGGLNLDTLYYEENLLPNRSYVYKLILTYNNKEYTESVNVTTLNITSSNFTWETFEFGQHSSSVLYDVAIISPENIWCVGEIYMNDGQGNPDPHAYNAVHWDGEKWEVKRISVNYNGNIISLPIYGIYAFSAEEIWLSSGVPIKGDGVNWTQYHLFDMGVLTQNDGYLTKIWGTSSSNLYYVGTLGTIAHYNGSSWRKIEIPVGIGFEEMHIDDIWGYEREGLESEIIITANRYPFTKKFYVCKIEESIVIPLYIGDLANEHPKSSNWFISGRKYYLAGGGIHSKININNEVNWKEEGTRSPYFLEIIRGMSYNKIFAGGNFGVLYYFNGIEWKLLSAQTGMSNGVISSISITKKLTVICGNNGNKAVITTIKN